MMPSCMKCCLPLVHLTSDFMCDQCKERTKDEELRSLRNELSIIAEQLGALGVKVDSGRHKYSDTQRLRRLLDQYLSLEERIAKVSR